MKDYFLFLGLLLKPKKFFAVSEVDGLLVEFDHIVFFMLSSVLLSLSICIVGFVIYLDIFEQYIVLIPLFLFFIFVVYFSSNSMHVLLWFYIFIAIKVFLVFVNLYFAITYISIFLIIFFIFNIKNKNKVILTVTKYIFVHKLLNYYELELRDIDDFKGLLTSDVEYNRQLVKHLGITNDIPEEFYNNHYYMYYILNAVLLYKRFNLFHITPTGYYYFDQFIINLEKFGIVTVLTTDEVEKMVCFKRKNNENLHKNT